MPKKQNIYEKMPWKSLEEYFELAMQYRCFGSELKKKVLKAQKKVDLTPRLRIPKNF